jgi:hypothetical protein
MPGGYELYVVVTSLIAQVYAFSVLLIKIIYSSSI